MQFIVQNKYLGIKWALFFAGIVLFNATQTLDVKEAEVNYLGASVVAVGVALYFLKKNRMLGKDFKGSIIIEGILLGSLLVYLFLCFWSGSWYESPLFFAVTPVWALLSYLYLVVGRVGEKKIGDDSMSNKLI